MTKTLLATRAADGPSSSGTYEPGARIARILVQILLTEQQTLVLRLEALAGRGDEDATREREALRAHMASHRTSLDRLFSELEMLAPPEGRPAEGA